MTHYLIIYLLPSLRDGKSDFEQRKSREQPLCGEESLRLLTPKSPEGDFAVDFIAVGNSFTVRILCKGSVGSGCTGMNSRVDPKIGSSQNDTSRGGPTITETVIARPVGFRPKQSPTVAKGDYCKGSLLRSIAFLDRKSTRLNSSHV